MEYLSNSGVWWKKKYKILVFFANSGGCAYYRALMPFKKLQEHFSDRVDIRFDDNPLCAKNGKLEPDESKLENIHWCDIILVNNISNFGGEYTARSAGIAQKYGKKVWVDNDDLLIELYPGHRLEQVYKEKGLYFIAKHLYSCADLVTVTQSKFAERIKPFIGKHTTLAVLKNAIDFSLECWNAPKILPPRKNLCRVGWAGGIHHEEDVKEFASIPPLVNQRAGRERVWWDFYGRPPQKPEERDWQSDVWDNYEKIIMKGFRGAKNYRFTYALPPDKYGVMYSAMDVAIAPLQMNNFNDSKSSIKCAECASYAVPLIASNVGDYEETIKNGVTGYLISPDAPKSEWVKILTKVIQDKKHREEMGQNLQKYAKDYFDINKVIGKRMELIDTVFGDLVK